MATPTKIKENAKNRQEAAAGKPEILAEAGAFAPGADDLDNLSHEELLILSIRESRQARKVSSDAMFQEQFSGEKAKANAKAVRETMGADRNWVSRQCDWWAETRPGSVFRTFRRVAEEVAPPLVAIGGAYFGIKWMLTGKEVAEELLNA